MTVTLRPFTTTSASVVLNGRVVATIVRRKGGYVVLGHPHPNGFHPTLEDARQACMAWLVVQKLQK